MKPLLPQLNKKEKRKLVIIRHGQTALNVDDRIRGWTDIPLDEKGKRQAKKLGEELTGSGIDILIASDLTRTLQTARIISCASGIPVVAISMALRPWNVGDYTGKSAEQVHKILVKHALETPEEPIKGGESFESFKYHSLMGVVSFLNEYPGKLIGFIGHHRTDRVLRAWMEKGCKDDFSLDFEHFFSKGIKPGTADVITIESNYLI